MLGIDRRQREVVPLGERRAVIAELAGGAGRLDADRAEHRLVEALGGAAIAHADRRVVERQAL
jgi:hypothetical protein